MRESGQRKSGVGCVETRAGCFLNFTNAHTSFANNRADQDVRDKEAKGIGLRLGRGWALHILVVEGSND